MAVEIKELVIRAVVEYPQSSHAGEEAEGSQSPIHETKPEIIQACVKQVLKILKKQEKR